MQQKTRGREPTATPESLRYAALGARAIHVVDSFGTVADPLADGRSRSAACVRPRGVLPASVNPGVEEGGESPIWRIQLRKADGGAIATVTDEECRSRK